LGVFFSNFLEKKNPKKKEDARIDHNLDDGVNPPLLPHLHLVSFLL
jgi:hypothetical protein